MIKFMVFNMDASLTWPCRQRDNDYSHGGRDIAHHACHIAWRGPRNNNDSERTCFESIRIDPEYSFPAGDRLAREPSCHVAS